MLRTAARLLTDQDAAAAGVQAPAPHQLLAGLRVVGFSHMVMGPICGMVLADMGNALPADDPGDGAGDGAGRILRCRCQATWCRSDSNPFWP